MKMNETIIDVTPIEYSSNRGVSSVSGGSVNDRARGNASSNSNRYQQPTWHAASSYRDETPGSDRVHYGSAYTRFESPTVVAQPGSEMLNGLVQVAAGAGLVMIGVPMLILPGPGLLAIAGGFALAASGMRKLFGIR